jgi:hypothetical protein
MSTVKPTNRDRELIRACGRFLVVRTGDLCRLFFPGIRRDTALFRLGQLRQAGFLAASRPSRTEEQIWHLGPAGRDWLRAQGIDPVRRPRAGALAHQLAVIAVWTRIAAACHARDGYRLRQVLPDWEQRSRSEARSQLVFPDLLVWIETPTGTYAVAIELDRAATEPLALIRQKLERYALALIQPQGLYGATHLTLVFALWDVGPRRAQSIKDLLAAHWGGRSFVTRELLDLETVLNGLITAPHSDPQIVGGGTGPVTRCASTLASDSDQAL